MFFRLVCLLVILAGSPLLAAPVVIEGATSQPPTQDQVLEWTFEPGVTVRMNAPPPGGFDDSRPTEIILFALPNGNTIHWTEGRALQPGMNWRYDIQHIAAQTRWLRDHVSDRNLVVVYLANTQKSWPAWRRENDNHRELIQNLVAEIRERVPGENETVTISGHSGGGSFLTGFLNGVEEIPHYVKRLVYLDSNYSYETPEGHGDKISAWLRGGDDRHLVVLAYDDRDVVLNGKKIVSDTGGTWRATQRMLDRLDDDFTFSTVTTDKFKRHLALDNRIDMIRWFNPELKILHTVMVGEYNGHIHSILSGTPLESPHQPAEPRLYTQYVQDALAGPAPIPPRPADARGGLELISEFELLERQPREERIREELLRGNIPDFLRKEMPVTITAPDAAGTTRTLTMLVMPDVLALGSHDDFVRMPMNPYTAQAFCDAFGYTMPTTKLSDEIWRAAELKLDPKPLTENRDAPSAFLKNHLLIQEQFGKRPPGTSVAGIKKDVVLSNRVLERANRVAIYGWHYPTGKPIQPLTIVHVDWYVDYSHGIRPIRAMMVLDGEPKSFAEIAADPVLHPLVSNEGPLQLLRYQQ